MDDRNQRTGEDTVDRSRARGGSLPPQVLWPSVQPLEHETKGLNLLVGPLLENGHSRFTRSFVNTSVELRRKCGDHDSVDSPIDFVGRASDQALFLETIDYSRYIGWSDPKEHGQVSMSCLGPAEEVVEGKMFPRDESRWLSFSFGGHERPRKYPSH